MDKVPKITALILAAGRGSRAGGVLPKQWQNLMGKPLINWSVNIFLNHKMVSQVVVVHHCVGERFPNQRLHARVVPSACLVLCRVEYPLQHVLPCASCPQAVSPGRNEVSSILGSVPLFPRWNFLGRVSSWWGQGSI